MDGVAPLETVPDAPDVPFGFMPEGRIPLIVSRGESNWGWWERYPRDRFWPIALNPHGTTGTDVVAGLSTSGYEVVEAWASFDKLWVPCVPQHEWIECNALLCSPAVRKRVRYDGFPVACWNQHTFQPVLRESQTCLIAMLALMGAQDIVIAGCDLEGDSRHVMIRRARMGSETDRVRQALSVNVWMDPESRYPELAPAWSADHE